MAGWPKSGPELRSEGYAFDGWGKCKSCGAKIAWTRTKAGSSMPLREVARPVTATEGERYFAPHHADCTEGASWTKKRNRR